MLGLSVPRTTQERRVMMAIIGLVVLETALVVLALVPAQLWTRLLPNSTNAALDGPFPAKIAPIITALLYILPTVIGFLCRSWQRALLCATLPAWIGLGAFVIAATFKVGAFYLVAPTNVTANVSVLELFAALGAIGWLGRHIFQLKENIYMQKSALRPLRRLRLVHFQVDHIDIPAKVAENGTVENIKGTQPALSTINEEPIQVLPVTPEGELPLGEIEARNLLKRTPGSYLLNQAYGLWFFASSFFLSVIITRKLNPDQYGVYAVAMTAFNTIAYIVALGLEDATYTYVPRVFAEHGKASASRLIKRLLALRVAILALCVCILLFTMPLLAQLFAAIPIAGSAGVAASLRDPTLLGHIAPIAFYVLGNGITAIISAVCAALMRMRIVFVLGSLTQLLLLGLGYIVLQLGWGIDGMLWLMAILSLINAAIFLIWLLPLLLARNATYVQPMKPVLQLGVSAWLTNLVTGALLKQVAIILLGYFAVSITAIGYFNLSFQLGHAASLLLVTGFGGVAGSALAAAFVGKNYDRLARSWQTLIKVETILAAPVLVFCLFNAQNIALVLYGSNYAPVGPLLAIFLFFNIIIRVLGTTIHQSTMYVIGQAKLVVLSMWIGLLVLTLLDILLIPRIGPAGALVADGISQVLIGGMMLLFLWRVLPRKYPIGFTCRLLLGLTIAALPGIIWHPTSRVLLGVSGGIFLVLCVGLLMLIKPLNAEDLEMVGGLNHRMASLLQWFAKGQDSRKGKVPTM